MRKLTYYVGMSIDGFIAAPDGSYEFYPLGDDLLQWFVTEYPEVVPTHIRKKLGIDAENRHFDIVVQGRATYEPALKIGLTSPYAHLRQYVVSRSITQSPDPAVEIISENPLARIRELKQEDGKGIYLAGGSALAGTLLPEIDELVIKLYPVVAGAGIPLFTTHFSPRHFELMNSRPFKSGAVVLTYARK
jgi:dihydrofolate reductase